MAGLGAIPALRNHRAVISSLRFLQGPAVERSFQGFQDLSGGIRLPQADLQSALSHHLLTGMGVMRFYQKRHGPWDSPKTPKRTLAQMHPDTVREIARSDPKSIDSYEYNSLGFAARAEVDKAREEASERTKAEKDYWDRADG